jgi:geranylgeranyl diphosphate synthase type II
MTDAVFPGGGRLRPRLVLAVAEGLGDPNPALSLAGAVAVELIHCSSLAHDDLPCFDDAPLRRGEPSVHAKHGEAIAVLVGDGLIVRAFEVVAIAGESDPRAALAITRELSRATGGFEGLVAGQAWEFEPNAVWSDYHDAKTGALFAAAAAIGAIASGGDPENYRALGGRIGGAYQLADDLADRCGQPEDLGKAVGLDDRKGVPSAPSALGVDGTLQRLQALQRETKSWLREMQANEQLESLVVETLERLLPKQFRGR